MIRAVIFDMDGVLVDSEPLHREVEINIFDKLGIQLSGDEHDSFIGLSARDMYSRLIETHHLQFSPEELIAFDLRERMSYFEALPAILPMKGMPELLDMLMQKNVPAAVASSSPRDLIRLVVQRMGMDTCFRELVSGESVGRGKPEPDIFLETARLLKAAPGNCAVIEDSYNGVRAAVSAGMTCIGFRGSDVFSQDISAAHYCVDDMYEAREILRGLLASV